MVASCRVTPAPLRIQPSVWHEPFELITTAAVLPSFEQLLACVGEGTAQGHGVGLDAIAVSPARPAGGRGTPPKDGESHDAEQQRAEEELCPQGPQRKILR